jgi:hypothetical protein
MVAGEDLPRAPVDGVVVGGGLPVLRSSGYEALLNDPLGNRHRRRGRDYDPFAGRYVPPGTAGPEIGSDY